MALDHSLSRPKAYALCLAGMVISLAIGLAGLLKQGPIQKLDQAFFDTLLVHTASQKPAHGTVVIDIDELSLSAVGQWPWPRYRVAALIQRIAAEKPAAIALDILFPEQDRTSLTNIQQTFKRDFGLDLSFNDIPVGLKDNDGYLGQEMMRAQVIGSRYFYFDHVTHANPPPRPGLGFDGRTDLLLSLQDAPGVLENTAAIASQTRISGFLNSHNDADRLLRRLPLLIKHQGLIHANLSLAATMHALGVSVGTIESDAHGLNIRIGTHRVPIDDAGYALLRFDGPSQGYDAISAADILNGRFRASDLRDKIVFIGSSAVGLNDVHATAIDPRFPGLKIQSVMAQNILDDHFARTPKWATQVGLVGSLLVGVLLSTLLLSNAGLVSFAAASILTSITLVAASAMAFANTGLLIPVAAPLANTATLCLLFFVVRFALHRAKARRWRKQLDNARQVTIESMASVAETRDPETGAHIKRTQHYVRAIADKLKHDGHYTETLTKGYIDLLFLSAPLHDIGKVGVPDHILLKPGRLTPDEMEIMKRHAEFGRKIIVSTAKQIEGDNFLVIAGEIAATHHEKWDGTGYPLGLSGQNIPLSGRIMAAADIYDALISRRCYKEPFTHEHATSLMREMRGTTFDPVVLDAFFAIETQIMMIAERYGDEPEHATSEHPKSPSDSSVATSNQVGVRP